MESMATVTRSLYNTKVWIYSGFFLKNTLQTLPKTPNSEA